MWPGELKMQQINLYLPEFRPNREPLRSRHMLWAVAVLLVFLILVSLYSGYRNQQLRDRIAAEQAQLQSLQQQVQQLVLQQPQNQRAQLEAEITRLQHERVRRERILAVITRQDLGNSEGFSAQLLTLARQSLDSIALERLSLQQGGLYVELKGTTRSADQVPLYLQRLRDDASFARVSFGVLRIERPENSGAPLQFELAKAPDEKSSARTTNTSSAMDLLVERKPQ